MHEVALAAADGRPVVGRVEGVTVIGTGCDLPGRVLDNDDVEVAADDWDRTRAGGSLEDWSVERLGVRRRHRLPADEGTATMATRASRRPRLRQRSWLPARHRSSTGTRRPPRGRASRC